MAKDSILAVIEGEPFLTRVHEYQNRRIATEKAWSEWSLANNGTGRLFHFDRLVAIEIDRVKGPPEGWVRVKNSKHFEYRPKKRTPAYKEMSDLPHLPSYTTVFSESDIPTHINHRNPKTGSYGGGILGYGLNPIGIGWLGDTFIVSLPNIPARVAYHRENYPDDIIENDLENWKLPEGLRQITHAQYKFIEAEHELKMEQEAD